MTSTGALDRQQTERFGITNIHGPSLEPGSDPNEAYRQVYSFPELKYTSTRVLPERLKRGLSDLAASKRQWIWPPPEGYERYVPPEQQMRLWRWEVPLELQDYYYEFGRSDGHDRYAVLGLFKTKITREADPHLFYFDTLTGLKWQARIPIFITCQRYLEQASQEQDFSLQQLMLGITRDGERVLVVASMDSLSKSLLFVYDGQGRLLRARVVPQAWSVPVGASLWGHLFSKIGRSASGNYFILDFTWSDPSGIGTLKASHLIDSEGRIRGRFVDGEGRPIELSSLGTTRMPGETGGYAVATRKIREGQWKILLYRLPEAIR